MSAKMYTVFNSLQGAIYLNLKTTNHDHNQDDKMHMLLCFRCNHLYLLKRCFVLGIFMFMVKQSVYISIWMCIIIEFLPILSLREFLCKTHLLHHKKSLSCYLLLIFLKYSSYEWKTDLYVFCFDRTPIKL